MDTPPDSRNQGEGKRKFGENWVRYKRFGRINESRFIIIFFHFFPSPRAKIVIYI